MSRLHQGQTSKMDSVVAISPPKHISEYGRSDGHTLPEVVQNYFDLAETNKNILYLYKLGNFYHILGENAEKVSKITGLEINTKLFKTPSVAWPCTKHDEMVNTLTDNGYGRVEVYENSKPVHFPSGARQIPSEREKSEEQEAVKEVLEQISQDEYENYKEDVENARLLEEADLREEDNE